MANIEQQPVFFEDLGAMPYQAAWDYQEKLLNENVRKKIEFRNQETEARNEIHHSPATTHHLLFVEHPLFTRLAKAEIWPMC
ncbi:hypothetical protein [Paraflavitalea speifideaquila]|uniref:hypothetical protein n=1 Tax=Paraflavitalea speifideaquila TaxID=3076558 RepID=UPI0028EF2B9E|nr:hypothetical protein [Paraflavitalea speifideiaquila]